MLEELMGFELALGSGASTSSRRGVTAIAGLVVVCLGGACSEDDTRQAPGKAGSAGTADGGSGKGGTGGGGGTGGTAGDAGSGGTTGGMGGTAGAAGGASGASGTGGTAGSDAGPGAPFTAEFGLQGDSYSRGVAIDSAGNIYWTGGFTGQIDFGGGVLTSAGDQDVFVVKLDAAGKHVWSRRYGDVQHDSGAAVAVDANGDAYVGGYFGGTIDFGNGGTHTGTGTLLEAFVVKLDGATADRVWSFGSTGSTFQNLTLAVAVTAQNELLAAGRSDSKIDFGNGPLPRNGAWFAKFGPTGALVFSDAYGTGASANATGLALDADGNALLTGDLWTTVTFGGQNLSAVGDHDTFLAKLDSSPTATPVFAKRYGDNGISRGGKVATDAQGNILLAGGLQGSIDFGGGAISSTNHGAYVAKLDPTSAELWSHAISPTGFTSEILWYDLAVELPSGDVVMVGGIESDVEFGGGVRTGSGGRNVFIVKYAAAGTHVFSALYGDDSTQEATDVAIDASGNAVVVGHLRGTLDFGSGPISSPNNDHVFIARVALP
jgi:hypothetical protein